MSKLQKIFSHVFLTKYNMALWIAPYLNHTTFILVVQHEHHHFAPKQLLEIISVSSCLQELVNIFNFQKHVAFLLIEQFNNILRYIHSSMTKDYLFYINNPRICIFIFVTYKIYSILCVPLKKSSTFWNCAAYDVAIMIHYH